MGIGGVQATPMGLLCWLRPKGAKHRMLLLDTDSGATLDAPEPGSYSIGAAAANDSRLVVFGGTRVTAFERSPDPQ